MPETLSTAMKEALRQVFRAQEHAIDERNRLPHLWVRMERKTTVDALVKRGLVEHTYRDWPAGWAGKLTETGLAERRRLRGET